MEKNLVSVIMNCFNGEQYLREAILVYLSVVTGKFIYQQVTPVDGTLVTPKVYTGIPEF